MYGTVLGKASVDASSRLLAAAEIRALNQTAYYPQGDFYFSKSISSVVAIEIRKSQNEDVENLLLRRKGIRIIFRTAVEAILTGLLLVAVVRYAFL